MSTRLALAALGFSALLGCAGSSIQQPEGASGYTDKQGASASKFAVAAANPLATKAGYDILKAGGSAVDAAIAVQMVLGLVEPQSSGIGGGAFLLHSAGGQSRLALQAYDGRETAPADATERLFLGADGKPIERVQAIVGGRSVGTPSVVKMLELAHQQHGKLAWSALFQPAIDLATSGFAISPRMSTLLARETHLKHDPVAAAYFYDKPGQPWPTGHILKNPEYAEVLTLIASQGSKGLHEGGVAAAIVTKVQSHPTNAGTLSMQDLADYAPKVREAFCTDYKGNFSPPKNTSANYRVAGNYLICGMPPPSSGALSIAQILGTLPYVYAREERDSTGIPTPTWLHLYLEASRLAFADRAQYIADPDFVAAPADDWRSLVAPDYLLSRAKLIGEQPMKTVRAGVPSGARLSSYAPMPDQVEHGTSHISIVDSFGNALAMTTTIEDAWGSRQMVNRGKGLAGGFLLNNQLTDFSFAPTGADGKPIANRVEGSKRPRSSMSPTLVFDKTTGNMVASLGSPGGELIIHYTAKTLHAMLNWGLSPQEAINLPNFVVFNDLIVLEKNRYPASTIEALKAYGHQVREADLTSGLQGILKTKNGFLGGADPRREGVILGD